MNLLNNERTYGIEIEAYGVTRSTVEQELRNAGINAYSEGYNHRTQAYWKVITDSSIRGSLGFELVSPPLSGEEGLNQIKVVSEVLNRLGAQINRSCGLHVHHHVADYDLQNFKNLYGLYGRFETTIDSFTPNSRRANNNRFTRSIISIAQEVQEARSLSQIQSIASDRYRKLNIQSYWRYGTVEFRQHSGTIDAEKIINWVILTQGMVERSLHTVSVQTNRTDVNFPQLKKVITRKLEDKAFMNQTFKFFSKRQKHFNGQEAA